MPQLAIPDDFIFRFIVADPGGQARAIARLMVDDGISTVVAVYRNDMWGTALLDATETRFENLTGSYFAEKLGYDPGAPDFLTLAEDLNSTVVAHGADGVLYIGFDEAADFFTEANNHSVLWTVNWYGSDGTALDERLIDDPEVAEFCNATGFINPMFSPTKSDKYDRVHDALEAQLGREPDPYAYNAYDIVWALTYSLSLVNRYDSQAVKAVLPEVTESLFGASGWIVLDEAGDRAFANYDLWIIVYEDPDYKWKLVGTWLWSTDSISWLP